MHSVRIEPTKLILVGTRITYQATRDAGIPILPATGPLIIKEAHNLRLTFPGKQEIRERLYRSYEYGTPPFSTKKRSLGHFPGFLFSLESWYCCTTRGCTAAAVPGTNRPGRLPEGSARGNMKTHAAITYLDLAYSEDMLGIFSHLSALLACNCRR